MKHTPLLSKYRIGKDKEFHKIVLIYMKIKNKEPSKPAFKSCRIRLNRIVMELIPLLEEIEGEYKLS